MKNPLTKEEASKEVELLLKRMRDRDVPLENRKLMYSRLKELMKRFEFKYKSNWDMKSKHIERGVDNPRQRKYMIDGRLKLETGDRVRIIKKAREGILKNTGIKIEPTDLWTVELIKYDISEKKFGVVIVSGTHKLYIYASDLTYYDSPKSNPYPQICPNCGAKIYAAIKPNKCPVCGKPWKKNPLKSRIPDTAKCSKCKATFSLSVLRERKDYKPGICPICGGTLKSVYEKNPGQFGLPMELFNYPEKGTKKVLNQYSTSDLTRASTHIQEILSHRPGSSWELGWNRSLSRMNRNIKYILSGRAFKNPKQQRIFKTTNPTFEELTNGLTPIQKKVFDNLLAKGGGPLSSYDLRTSLNTMYALQRKGLVRQAQTSRLGTLFDPRTTILWKSRYSRRLDVKPKENPTGLFQSFHGAQPTHIRKIKYTPPPKRLIKVGRLSQINYVPEFPSERRGSEFYHKSGDTGSKVLKSNLILATDEKGKNLYLLKESGSKYPIFTDRGIIG